MGSSSDILNYYAWPSTVNVANFVTVKASLKAKGDERIKNWKLQMLCLLESQDVAGFVDGEILPPPPENNAEKMKQWRRTDMLVKGWIFGSIEGEVLDIVGDKPTARDVWLQLQDNIFKEEEEEEEEEEEHQEVKTRGEVPVDMHLTLYKAAQRGDWDTAHELFEKHNPDMTAFISFGSETALQVAVFSGKANEFVKKTVNLMTCDGLALTDYTGSTVLHSAALVGNTEAAMAMIDKNPNLPDIPNYNNRLPVLIAAEYCHRKTLEYLISKSNPNAFEGQSGVDLLNAIIVSEFYDVALELIYKYPNLALLRDDGDNSSALSTLTTLTAIPSAFLSRESFSWWQSLIYYCIPIQKSKREASQETDGTSDIESTGGDAQTNRNDSTSFQIISGVKQKLVSVVWKIIQDTVPLVRGIRNKKAVHQQALELANYLCRQTITLPEKKATSMLKASMKVAADLGVSEVVEMIMEMYPLIIWNGFGDSGETIFYVAAMERFENIFSLIYSMSDLKRLLYYSMDNENNNLMHKCGKLAPAHKLNLVPGAALQMQRELQWFKEMENFVHPALRMARNNNNQTPYMVFTSEHQKLKTEGERWMKDTANACTIAAALIATVMFTAAFTVPGGIDSDTGVPIFVEQPAFTLFAISDIVSLFTSVTSLLMFLSILTSRYAEEDFLYVLPKRLIIGLLSLFISITFMLGAFSATMYLVFRGRQPWFLIPVAALACLPVASFVRLQFPLLVDVVYSTYGPSIFRKKTDRIFY